MDIIKIKCPFDGAVLSVRNQPGIESKSVTCPVCKNKFPFRQFKRIEVPAPSDEGDTQYSGAATGENTIIGQVRLQGPGMVYKLKPGRNVIGRAASKSSADFAINTGESRSMSREHIVIEVKSMPGKGLVHFISLAKERVNATFVGDEELLFGDCLILNDGDIIRLPDAELRFSLPDPDATEY